ncbi:MAG TPA: tripartite tricarboxylate transporter substrate binding protein [Burkholderiales bacterium]|nr:tripartite tricarboxylate transporter substrate binding protein [Burkholderiales bacterium]
MAKPLWLAIGGMILLAPAITWPQAYPSKPIRIVVPFAPSGNIDINARTIAPGLTEVLKQPVIVENRAGAGGRIGSTFVAKAPPDGYTVLLGAPGTLVSQPVFQDDIEYKPLSDFVYTSQISLVASALSVHPSMPVKSVKELIAFAKARPGEVLMGSAGLGSGTHLMGELFQSLAKVKFTHVPYKGGAGASVAILSGQIHLSFDQVTSSGPQIRAGKLRALAVTTPQRSKFLPEVPTIDEAGVRGYDYSTWTTLAIPAATPKDVVQKLRDAVDTVIAQPRVREAFEKLGAEVVKNSPAEFTRRLQDDYARWVRIRKETGIKFD